MMRCLLWLTVCGILTACGSSERPAVEFARRTAAPDPEAGDTLKREIQQMPEEEQPFQAMLPRAIETNEDRIECLERAKEFILRTAGAKSALAIRDGYVALIDANGGGFSKIYPDGVRVRLNIRGSGIADVNVFAAGYELAPTHVHIDDTLMDDAMFSIKCLSGDRDVAVSLIASPDRKNVRSLGPWDQIENGEELRVQCLAWYREMRVIRGHWRGREP